MRAIVLGAKFDECPACHQPGPHLLVRKTHWFTLFRIPVILLWVSNGLLCTGCAHCERIGFRAMRRGLRTGRLPLERHRPGFEAAARSSVGEVDPSDWTAFGLSPGSSAQAIQLRWRKLAKQLHPDAGGDATTFVRMQAVRGRLLRAQDVSTSSAPDPAEVFDPVIRNPKRGFFDAYLKVWPILAALVLVVSILQPRPTTDTTGSGNFGFPATPNSVNTPSGTAHTCWASGSEINGCMSSDGSAMLFGDTSGTRTTCWFIEPLLPNQSARCLP
jgi:hypothetical protein